MIDNPDQLLRILGELYADEDLPRPKRELRPGSRTHQVLEFSLEGVLRPGRLKPVLQTKSPRARHGVQPLGCTDPGQAEACTPNLAHGLIRRGQAEACTPNDEITRT